MTIIVENGSIVAGANSYTTVANARVILSAFGQDLDDNTEVAEQQLLMAMSYIEAFRAQFKGIKTIQTQPVQWPRGSVIIDGYTVDSDSIPQELINAQVYAAYEIDQGEGLQDNSTNQSVQSEEVVGAVKVSYFDTGSIDGKTTFVRVNDELNVLLKNGGARGSVRGMRG